MFDQCGRYVDERGFARKVIDEVRSIPPIGWLYFSFVAATIVIGVLLGWPDYTIGR